MLFFFEKTWAKPAPLVYPPLLISVLQPLLLLDLRLLQRLGLLGLAVRFLVIRFTSTELRSSVIAAPDCIRSATVSPAWSA
jgi:hypothetical protein